MTDSYEDTITLKPCPFCGATPRLTRDASWYVQCQCGVEGAYYFDDYHDDAQEQAVISWNTRFHSGKPYAYDIVAPDGHRTLLRSKVDVPNHIAIPLYRLDDDE